MAKNDKAMFYKHLKQSCVYFEYGSGGSTYQASINDNIKKIYSVESDLEWQTKLKTIVSNPNITYFFNEMDVRPNTWGSPGKNATEEQKKAYSNYIRDLSEDERNSVDMILIDGRFRVACCLKCHEVISESCVIAFDDFLNRPPYHIVLDYYDIIEQTTDNRMVILKKKMDTDVPQSLIEKYELVPN